VSLSSAMMPVLECVITSVAPSRFIEQKDQPQKSTKDRKQEGCDLF
jgi:hypothetical protein